MNKVEHLVTKLSRAANESGRTVVALLYEMIRLRFSIGRIGVSEYLSFRLHLKDITFADKCAYGGYRAQAILEEILVDDYARFLSLDKISMYALLRAYGLPVPELRAVYRSIRPQSLRQLHSPSELASYLSAPESLPVYMKPSFGSYGRGNALLQRETNGTLMLGDGSEVALQAFCESLDDGRGLGWMLQEPLSPHSLIADICGNKISGVRIHTFLSPTGPVITKAIWKINIGREDSDNFRHGESGNLLAALDLQSGQVTRVVSGVGLDQELDPPHPVSGLNMVGFTLPYWSDIKALVCDAQLAFPGYLCPGWDVAICEDGPKLLEVNFFGDIDLSQHAHRRGFLDNEFLSLMKDRGIDQLLLGPTEEWKRSKRNIRLGRRRHHWNW